MFKVIHGDCLKELQGLPDGSIDAIVTDPPYGISFMGKKWDYQIPEVATWRECLRVLKPGGHALIACGTRTQHRMAVNIEDAGFEIRDVITWLYGSGFPKSHNLDGNHKGWGTALKPACEFWTLARKPLEKGLTVAQNVTKWGTGAINVDGCRIEGEVIRTIQGGKKINGGNFSNPSADTEDRRTFFENTTGRWPANLILDEGAAAALDEQSGILKSGARNGVKSERKSFGEDGTFKENARDTGYCSAASLGGASRFFYVAKASKSERNAGLEGMPLKKNDAHNNPSRMVGSSAAKAKQDGMDKSGTTGNQNHHPTVKPIKLMTYLCRLVTPPGGTVLDPFAGSGSTGVAAKSEGLSFLGIEREEQYVEIAQKRINATEAPCQESA